jgi:putative membrane protein
MSQGSSPMTGVEDRGTGGAAPQNWGSHLRHLLVGFLMGCAEVVPGVSGGTVALIGGVYTRLIDAVRDAVDVALTIVRGRFGEGVRRLRGLDWVFLVPMGIGMVVAVLSLARLISHFLEEEPVKVSGLFAGLVLGSVVVAFALIRKVEGSTIAIVVGVGTVMFLLLGLRQETEAAEIDAASAPLWAYPLAASIAICAWILPGVSGSLMLVMMGMYAHVFASLDDREMLPLVLFAVGAVMGLAVFSKVLAWLLDRYHDQVVAVMIGLMFGSLRVLWPWPGGVDSTKLEGPGDDMVIPILLAVLGFVVVSALGRTGVVTEEPAPDSGAEADGAGTTVAQPGA